jgi:hypothetical protein
MSYIKLLKATKFHSLLPAGTKVQVDDSKGKELVDNGNAVWCDRAGVEILKAESILKEVKKVKRKKIKDNGN